MRRTRIVLLALAVAATAVLGVSLGPVDLSPTAVWHGLLGTDPRAAAIVRDLRVPRVFLGLLVGGSLGVCGAALQALVRNPLADPYLLGLSGGAGLGAVAAIALSIGGPWGIPVAAFLGALGAVALVYRLSVVAGRRIDPRVLLLAGVVVGSFAAAVMSAIITLASASQLRNAFLWLLGGLGGASWRAVSVFALYAVLPLAALVLQARTMDLLALGEEPAQYLGADVERAKRVIVIATAILTAASVAVCGIVGFVGLVVPHAVRLTVGPLHRGLLPTTFLVGGGFLVLCDTVARIAVRPIELPVTVVTALVGVPLFAVLLRRTMA